MILRITGGVALPPRQLIGSLPFSLAVGPVAGPWIFYLRTVMKTGTTELALMHLLRQHWESASKGFLKFATLVVLSLLKKRNCYLRKTSGAG